MMQCPTSPRGVFRSSKATIPSSPVSRGRVPTESWSIRKNNRDAVAEDEVTKPVSPGKLNRRRFTTNKSPVSPSKSKVSPRHNDKSSIRPPTSASPSGSKSWSFGKQKDFKKPLANARNKKATVTLQRYVRGWWARLHFKVALLEYKLSHNRELTDKAMDQMKKGVEQKKQYERNKMEAHFASKVAAKAKADAAEKQVVEEGKDIISHLRNENKKLRDKNDRILRAAMGLKEQNSRLAGVNTQTDGNMGILESHAKQIEETHTKLNHVVPKYKSSVAQLSQAAEQHRQFCVGEHSIKLMYVKLIGKLVDILEERNMQPELTDEIVGYVLAMEGKDNDMPLPEKLHDYEVGERDDTISPHGSKQPFGSKSPHGHGHNGQMNGKHQDDDDDSDSENYDEYSVATFD